MARWWMRMTPLGTKTTQREGKPMTLRGMRTTRRERKPMMLRGRRPMTPQELLSCQSCRFHIIGPSITPGSRGPRDGAKQVRQK